MINNHYNMRVEQEILGCLMISNEAWSMILSKRPEDLFYDKRHRKIFSTLLSMREAKIPTDGVSVCELIDNGEIEHGYICSLPANSTGANFSEYMNILNNYGQLRKIEELAGKILKAVKKQSAVAFKIASRASSIFNDIADSCEGRDSPDYVFVKSSSNNLSQIVQEYINRGFFLHGPCFALGDGRLCQVVIRTKGLTNE